MKTRTNHNTNVNVTSDRRKEFNLIKGLNAYNPTGINEQNRMQFVVILKE